MKTHGFLRTVFAHFAQAIDTLTLMHYEAKLENTTHGIAYAIEENPQLLSIQYQMSPEEQKLRIKNIQGICRSLEDRIDHRAQKYNID